jgi:putative transcriptional regulator
LTTPAHHPSETLLLEYAAGTLREPQALALATHLAFCPDCRRHATLLDGLGDALLDEIDPDPMPAGALPALLQRLDNAPALPKGGAASTRGFGKSAGRTGRADTAAGLSRRSAAACGLDRAVRRRPFPPPASRPPSDGRRNSESGSRFFTGRAPTHERELILGLQGAFSEEAGPGSVRGGSFAVGDLGEFGCGSAHAVVAGNAGCIMLQGFGQAGDAADGKLSRTLPAR